MKEILQDRGEAFEGSLKDISFSTCVTHTYNESVYKRDLKKTGPNGPIFRVWFPRRAQLKQFT